MTVPITGRCKQLLPTLHGDQRELGDEEEGCPGIDNEHLLSSGGEKVYVCNSPFLHHTYMIQVTPALRQLNFQLLSTSFTAVSNREGNTTTITTIPSLIYLYTIFFLTPKPSFLIFYLILPHTV